MADKVPTVEIDPRHKLPCDFIVGAVRFRKGVKLETVRRAASRWMAAASCQVSDKAALQRMLDGITAENCHPAVGD